MGERNTTDSNTGYLKRETRKRYDHNPFLQPMLNDMKARGVVGVRTHTFRNQMEKVIDENGEENILYRSVKTPVDREHFIKCYSQLFERIAHEGDMKLFNLTTARVLNAVLSIYLADTNNFGDQLYLNFNLARQHPHNFKQSRQQWTNGINRLIELKLIEASVNPNMYYINPSCFCKSGRLEIVESITHRDQLNAYRSAQHRRDEYLKEAALIPNPNKQKEVLQGE